MSPGEKIKLIAILGTDRSGSTLLDKIISSNPGIFSVGEIHRFINYYQNNYSCTCGKQFYECEFWKAVLMRLDKKKFNPHLIAILGWRKRVRILFMNLFRGEKGLLRKHLSYSESYAHLLGAVKEVSGAEYLVDSCKDMVRITLLHLSGFFNIFPVYITRPLQDYIVSVRKPQMKLNHNRKSGPVKASLRWTFRNIETTWLIRSYYPNHVQVSYRSLVECPERVIDAIAKKTGIFLQYDPVRIRERDYHFLGGNFMKFKEFLGVEPDEKDTSDIMDSIGYRTIASILNRYFVRDNI